MTLFGYLIKVWLPSVAAWSTPCGHREAVVHHLLGSETHCQLIQVSTTLMDSRGVVKLLKQC